MAIDGPRLMQGDGGAWFCSLVHCTINNGQLDVDYLLKKYEEEQRKNYEDDDRELNLEEYRLMAELVKVLHQGRVEEELWNIYEPEEEGYEPSVYDILEKAVISRETLELLLSKSKKLFIHMNGIGFEYYKDVDTLRERGLWNYCEYKNIQEKEELDKIVEEMKKATCDSLEVALKMREKLKKIKTKYPLFECSEEIINDINSLLFHGWVKEEYYLNMVNSIKESIDTIKEILDNPKESYVLYTKK